MRRQSALGIGLGWCLALSIACAMPGDKGQATAEPAEVEGLIRQLASEQFTQRESATRNLDRLGAAALPALQAAVANSDVEVRRRCLRLIHDIEQRLETAELLQPTKTRLDFEDAPLGEILKDLSKRMGFDTEITTEQKELSERRVTIHTPELPFWQAFDQLCEKAEVTAKCASHRQLPATGTNGVQPFGALSPAVVVGENAIIMVAGKPMTLPTFHAGALRLRALPSTSGDLQATKGEAVLTLELAVEPKIQWQNLVQLRFDDVRDDKHNLLVATTGEEAPKPMTEDDILRLQMRALQQQRIAMKISPSASSAGGIGAGIFQTKVRLTVPDGAGRTIPRFRGTLIGQVQTPVQALATIVEPAQALQQAVKAKDGAEIKIISFKATNGGAIEARVEIAPSQNGLGQGNMVVNMQVVVGGNARGLGNGFASPLSGAPLTLKDADGQLYTLSSVRQNLEVSNNGALTQKYTLYWQPPQAKSTPKMLLYVGSRLATVEVPFELRDVPLP